MKPDFPSLADEIAEPHPDMNIKVAAFTVNEKSSNTTFLREYNKGLRLCCLNATKSGFLASEPKYQFQLKTNLVCYLKKVKVITC